MLNLLTQAGVAHTLLGYRSFILRKPFLVGLSRKHTDRILLTYVDALIYLRLIMLNRMTHVCLLVLLV